MILYLETSPLIKLLVKEKGSAVGEDLWNKRILATWFTEMSLVDVTDDVTRFAGDLAERHRLRALDAIHLASAITVANPDLVVATWDADLAHAAVVAGLTTAGAPV